MAALLAVWLPRLYVLVLCLLAVYGLLGLATLALFWRWRGYRPTQPPAPDAWPPVTVQLPLFNEQAVAQRAIDALARLDYPRDRLQIQVLDDSTDETTAIAQAAVQEWQAAGVRIDLLHRGGRRGYKAGALQDGLATAEGTLIAIFDADFVPAPDFLRRTVPHLTAEPRLAAVQTRWEHLNADDSILTRAQAIALDKHFAVEQAVRFAADLFPKFNGSGGVWRRAALEEVGGWQGDTLCEDLCLSTRAVLAGWQLRYLPDSAAPAELPDALAAYKHQQARWAKGSLQCLLKYGRRIAGAARQRPFARLYALLSMSGYWTAPLVLLLLLLQLPLLLTRAALPAWLPIFSVAAIGQPLLFFLAQIELRPDWRRRVIGLPLLLGLAIGIAPMLTRSLAEVVLGRLWSADQSFRRTPKGVGQHTVYRPMFDRIVFVEAGLALYALATAGLAWQLQRYGLLPFLLGSALCLGLTAWGGRGGGRATANGEE